MTSIKYRNRTYTVAKRETVDQVAERFPMIAKLMVEHGKVAQLEMLSPTGKAALGYEFTNGKVQVIPV